MKTFCSTKSLHVFAAAIFFPCLLTAATSVYVDQADDYTITTDQGSVGVLDSGDTVTWNGTKAVVSGLTFGTDAFISVQAAIDAADYSGTVHIAAGTYLEGTALLIADRVTLQGDGAALTHLSGGDVNRVIQIGSFYTSVSINDLTIRNGLAESYGGGIYNTREVQLFVNRCVLSANVASQGGGIYSLGETAISESTLSGNSASNYGGAVYVRPDIEDGYGGISITDSTISGNSANTGGALYLSNGSVSIFDSSLFSNTANYSGGAIASRGASVVIKDSTFSANSAVDDGGAIDKEDGGSYFITDSTFSENTADHGAAIFSAEAGFIAIGDSLITGNLATVSGGGLYVDGGTYAVVDSVFTENSAEYGGAISSYTDGLSLIDRSTFSKNTATDTGGALDTDSGALSIEESIFSENAADQGGAIYSASSGSVLSVERSTLTANTAISDGGAMMISYGSVSVEDSTLSANTAVSGGAIASDSVASVRIDRSTMVGNLATAGGAISHADSRDAEEKSMGSQPLEVFNSTLSANHATGGSGGAILANGELVLAQSTLTANTSTQSGGGIYNEAGDLVTVVNSIVAGNTASVSGGDLSGDFLSEGVNFVGLDSGFVGFRVGIDLSFASTGSTIGQLLDTTLTNSAGHTLTHRLPLTSPAVDAGANANVPGDVSTDQRGIKRVDTALVDIGAVEYFYPPALFASTPANGDAGLSPDQVITLTFDRTLVTGSGEILLRRSDTDEQVPVSVSIVGDTVTLTPLAPLPTNLGFYVEVEADALLNELDRSFPGIVGDSDLAFYTCFDEVYVDAVGDFTPANPVAGNLVTWHGSSETVAGLVFGANAFASVQDAIDFVCVGGVVHLAAGSYFEGSQISISSPVTLEGDGPESTILSGNNSHRVVNIGAGVDQLVTLRSLSIIDGRTLGAYDGAGLYNNLSDLALEDVSISGNESADNGGGLYLDGGESTFMNVTVATNTAEDDGGGLMLNAGSLDMVEVAISGNVSTSNQGGGIYNRGTVTLSNATISGNWSASDGGGIYSSSGGVELINVTVSGNTADHGNSEGGGLWNDSGHMLLTQVTVTNNSAGKRGGGIFNQDDLTITNSIVAENQAGEGADFRGSFTSVGVNFIGDEDRANGFREGTDLSFFSTGTTIDNLLNTTLADNGGWSFTHRLVDGSSAIDAGSNADVPVSLDTDQRGYDRFVGLAVDLGALEYRMGQQLSLDTDGDGSPTAIEIALGTDLNVSDPSHPNNLIEPTFNLNGDAVLSFGRGADTGSDFIWILERSMTLEPDSFVELFRFNGLTEVETAADNVSAIVTSSGITVYDEAPPEKAFYRVKILPSE